MSLIPWRSSFSDLDNFFKDEDWVLPVFPRINVIQSAIPAMDIKETDKEIIVEVEIPGFDPEKIDVSVEDGILKIKGLIDEKKEEKEKGYWRKEIHKHSFERKVQLPFAVKENAINAIYEKGVLKITMPKVETKPSSNSSSTLPGDFFL